MTQPLALAIDTVPFPTVSEAWCVAADLTSVNRPCITNTTGIDLDSVCRVASDILRVLSGRRYGIRRTTVRPYRDPECPWPGVNPPATIVTTTTGWNWYYWNNGSPPGLLLPTPAAHVEVAVEGAWLNRTFSDGAITTLSATLRSTHAAFTVGDIGGGIVGAGIPAGATIATFVNATTVTLSAPATKTGTTFFTLSARPPDWYLYDAQLLVRARDGQWPATNDLSRPLGDTGTWGVTYEAGLAVPEGGVLAARAFACQLLKLVADEACAVPAWVSGMSRQGNTINLDPDVFLAKGRTGVMLADYWLNAVNPHGQRRRARIAGPETIREARPNP
jgi:hypothetical protein